MNGRSGRPSRPPGGAHDLQSQVGFYLLPPDQANQGHSHHSKSKKKSRNQSKGQNQRRWASQNQLDVITEASDESRPHSPSGRGQKIKIYILKQNTVVFNAEEPTEQD
jgi:hypothetical protein